MFERGFFGRRGPLMYEPAIKIPLLIHAPGQETRRDIHTSTSNVDVVSTILSFANKEIPSGLDGQVLPGFGGAENSERPLFSMNAIENSQFLPVTKAAISMNKDRYKLIAYLGYKEMESAYEFYDLENEPEELENLAGVNPTTFSGLKEEFLDHLAEANRPYLKKDQAGG